MISRTLYNSLPFLVAIVVIVFVHEMGHFLVARWCGVKVTDFSVGFGPEILHWYDKHGTRWKLCWLPLGGYVKFAGDSNAASLPDGSTKTAPAEPGDFHTMSLTRSRSCGSRSNREFPACNSNFHWSVEHIWAKWFYHLELTGLVAGGAAEVRWIEGWGFCASELMVKTSSPSSSCSRSSWRVAAIRLSLR